jgi:hypothetical protein
MLRLATLLLQEDHDALRAATPRCRQKVLLSFLQLCIPVFLWCLAAGLVAGKIFHAHWALAMLSAAVMGFLIFVLDRSILTLPTRSDEELARGSDLVREPYRTRLRNGLRRLVAGLPTYGLRFTLVLLGALLNASLLDLLIFERDIDTQVRVLQQEAVERDLIPAALGEADRRIAALALQRDTFDARYQRAAAAFTAEIDGRSGTGRTGYGVSARAKEALQQDAARRLEEAETALDALRAKRTARADSLRATAQGDPGVLTRMKALHRFVFGHEPEPVAASGEDGPATMVTDARHGARRDPLAFGFWIALLALVLLLEGIVLLYKLSMPPTLYERGQALRRLEGQRALAARVHLSDLRDRRIHGMDGPEWRAREALAAWRRSG